MTAPNSMMRGATYPSGAGSLLPNPFLYTLPRTLWDKVKEFFGYTANFTGVNVLTASGNVTVQTVVQNDSAFILLGIGGTVTSTDEATRLTYVPQTIQIQDQTAGKNLFDQATHFMNVVGTAGEPFYFAIPKLVQPGATLSTTLNNLEATARNVRLTFYGFKVYDKAATGE